jgi:large subunit ribosomal protein L17
MRHGNKINHLSRTYSHRAALLSNMAASLIMHKRISTTLAKAKELRGYIEPLLTRGKTDTTHNRRMVFRYLQNKQAVTELFREIGSKIAERNGGYTRILKTGTRKGDQSEMCFIELVDYNANMLKIAGEKKAKTTRRGRKPKAKAEAAPAAAEEAKAPAAPETTPPPSEEAAS